MMTIRYYQLFLTHTTLLNSGPALHYYQRGLKAAPGANIVRCCLLLDVTEILRDMID